MSGGERRRLGTVMVMEAVKGMRYVDDADADGCGVAGDEMG